MKFNRISFVLALLVAIALIQTGATQADAPEERAAGQSTLSASGAGNFWLAWTPAVNISSSPTNEASWPDWGITPDGQTLFLAWSDGRDGPTNIHYALSSDGGENWGGAQRLWASTNNSVRPSLVIHNGVPTFAWADETSPLHHAIHQMALGEASYVTVPNPNTYLASVPRLAAGSGGDLHLALQGGAAQRPPDILYARKAAGQPAWPVPTVVFTHTASGSFNPAIAVGSDGTVHLTWQESSGTSSSAVYYLAGDGTNWGTPRKLSAGIATSVRPAIAIGPEGTIYAAWGEKAPDIKTQYVRIARSEDGGSTWTAPTRIDDLPVSANSVSPTDVAPALAVTPSGAVCAAWHGFRPGASIEAEEILVTCSGDRGESWGSLVNVSRSSVISIRPVMAAESDGILHIAWQEYAGPSAFYNYQIYYAHTVPCVVYMPIVLRSHQ